jgi:hypothetical protein
VSSGTAAVDLANPDAFVDGVPHEALAVLRRTDPVRWQPMDGEPDSFATIELTGPPMRIRSNLNHTLKRLPVRLSA